MKGKSLYTKKLSNIVASLAQPDKMVKYHVISGDSNWRVVSEGNVKALRAFSTVEQAVDYAKGKASKKTGEVVIHEDSGRIKDRISYKII
jgi:hypothetical protein